jgi:hypothetical protein
MTFFGPIPTNPSEAWQSMWAPGIAGIAVLIYVVKERKNIPAHQRKNVPFVVGIGLLLFGTWVYSWFRT